MKKLLLSLMVFLPAFGFCQTMELTPNGFVDKDDNSKSYVVLTFDGVSQANLFKKAKQFVNQSYNSPKTVSSEISNEQLVIDGRDSKDIRVIYHVSGPNLWNFTYKYEMQFKDGKIRFAPLFKSLRNSENASEITLIGAGVLGSATGMFNKKGKASREKGNQAVEESVNSFISELKKAIVTKSDDW
ncbi:hypothetical protein H8S90_21325 [Olivibacter sp. SDN3]|uniref:hypothetical protein n=1 Tax=Olivibacter sp. SDN3 TaxID=2764720 RepID=UPI001650D8E5|nr:hypothetical protein [Olivibacter sp. SDN3]QNL49254.1 hypothetical protein H8S90_21325 [Olivibacter sp. SDN3]